MSERVSNAFEPTPETGPLARRAGAIALGALIFAGLASVYYFYSQGLSNLYGDGLAHVEGARRLFDSRTPGYSEIGSTWLPLFHILASPLAQNNFLWRTGLAGSFVSAAAFIITGWFLFQFSRRMNGNIPAGVLTLAIFLLCPSMLFLASTPLTEPLALMWAILVTYSLFLFQQTGSQRALIAGGTAAFFGTLTRYDGWFLLPFAAAVVLLVRKDTWRDRFRNAILFSLIAGAGPLLWFLHNAYRFGNPLDFYNGPNSAKAIYAHQLATTAFRYPTDGSLMVSARYYLADLIMLGGAWPLELAILGLLVWILERGASVSRLTALLLWVPFVFYVQSMAGAAIPIYLPILFPYTYYNLRYGIEMLPAIAIFAAFALSSRITRRARTVLLVVFLCLITFQCFDLISNGFINLPVVQEGIRNNPCQSKRQQALIAYFGRNYDGGTILVASGKWPCVMPALGIPFAKTLSEPDAVAWRKLHSEIPLEIGWIIRGDDDRVDELMRAYPKVFFDFALVEKDDVPGEGSVGIYRRRSN